MTQVIIDSKITNVKYFTYEVALFIHGGYKVSECRISLWIWEINVKKKDWEMSNSSVLFVGGF